MFGIGECIIAYSILNQFDNTSAGEKSGNNEKHKNYELFSDIDKKDQTIKDLRSEVKELRQEVYAKDSYLDVLLGA